MLTTMELFDDAALTALIASATVLGADLKAGLITNTPGINKRLVIGDLVEPGYASYVRQAVVMGPVFRDPINGIGASSAALVWQETGTVTSVVITGIFYTYGAGPLLMGVEMFPTPIPLHDVLDAFSSILTFLQSNQNPGYSTTIQ